MVSLNVVILILIFKVIKNCEVDTFFNNSVTLIGAKDVKTVSGCFEPNKDLVKVSYIQIINESIPILRRQAINALPNLVDVLLINDNITETEPGAFFNLNKLYLIKLEHNRIRRIRNGVFNHLLVRELCLTNNSIEAIDVNAFDDMPNLQILFLNENKLSQLNSDWFKRSPNIAVLNFEYNFLNKVPQNAFQHINGMHYDEEAKLNVTTNILLNNNMIKELMAGAFDYLNTLGWLFLHKNHLEEIPIESFRTLTNIDWIRLEHNKLKCVPQELVEISPKVTYYLSNNPLSDECKRKYPEIS